MTQQRFSQLPTSNEDFNANNRGSNNRNAASANSTPVKQMFNGRSVFITGASGFIGRVLLVKLLTCYPGIRRIYLMMRPKRDRSPESRLEDQILSLPIFDALHKANKDIRSKLTVIEGDLTRPKLGINEQDMDTLVRDHSLSFVFHVAATIRFDEPLPVAIQLNLAATKQVMDLGRSLKNLISFCHVSTAYVNSDICDGQQWIEERLYPISDASMKLIEQVHADSWQKSDLGQCSNFDGRPNSYTYTKALAEHLLFKYGSDLPLVIVRPSIVVGADREPLPGWIDNLNGPTGLILAIGKGLLRTMQVRRNVKADIVPVDYVVNAMIASTYFTTKSKGNYAPSIVHCNTGDLNAFTWGQIEDNCFSIVKQYPSEQVFRYPMGSFKSNKYVDLFVRLFVHTLPAFFIDLLCMVLGKKRQLNFIYGKLHGAIGCLKHFMITNYNYKTSTLKKVQKCLTNEQDQKDLYIELDQIDWLKFWHAYVLGARRFILQEKDSTLGEARRRLNRAYYREIGFRAILIGVFLYISRPYILAISPL